MSRHVTGSNGTSGGSYQVSTHKMEAYKNNRGDEEERAAEEIRSRIRGWSVGESRKMGTVSEVSVEVQSVCAGRGSVGSESEILAGLGRTKSLREMGGVVKTVVYDVTYEN